MKLVTRYVLKEHAGPLAFALAALTSLLLLQYVARQLEKLVGKGLPWTVIAEFFVLSLPFTVAMTMPMAVLVATLYAFGRMAAEHEITAFKASGVRVRRLMAPVLLASAAIALAMVVFNDQVLPRANHRLAVLTGDIASAKPTLALREQVINQVTPTFYMRVGRLDSRTNRMRDVVIYDVANPSERQTIYADSGYLAAAPSRADLDVVLFDGVTQRFARGNPERLERVQFRTQAVRVRDIYRNFSRTTGEQMKTEREMSVCEMEAQYFDAAVRYEKARRQYQLAARDTAILNQLEPAQRRRRPPAKRRVYRGIGTAYCRGVQALEQALGVSPRRGRRPPPATLGAAPDDASSPGPGWRAAADQAARWVLPALAVAQPATQPPRPAAPTTAAQPGVAPDAAAQPWTKPGQPVVTPPPAPVGAVGAPIPGATIPSAGGAIDSAMRAAGGTPAPATAVPGVAAESTVAPTVAPSVLPSTGVPPDGPPVGVGSAVAPSIGMVVSDLETSAIEMNKYDVEIQKKFALAVACFVFVLFGPPIALRFPRGGVGATIGVSLGVFGVYYACLMAGEALADRGLLPPWIAMWGANVIFTVGALALLWSIERTADQSRGGGLVDRWHDWWARRALARPPRPAAVARVGGTPPAEPA